MRKRLIVIGPDDIIDIVNRNNLSCYDIWYSGKERKTRWEEKYECKWAGVNLEEGRRTGDKLLVACKTANTRRRIIEFAKKNSIEIIGVIDKDAIIFESSNISPSSIIYPSAIASSFSTIFENTIISYASLIGHGVCVENGGFISPHVRLLGDSIVGEDSFIGTGTTVLPGVKIGRKTWIGPNLVIGSDVADRTKVLMIGGRLRYVENSSE